ncbi:hypothetical protein LLH23_02125 [bacterium]|nr:hypothetical protein [bacterium]
MDCRTCREHFTELLEGTAPAAAVQHVAGCEECGRALVEVRDTVRELRSLPVVAPPAGLLRDISRAVDAAARPAQTKTWWQPLAAGLSMAACVCLLVWAVVLHPVGVTSDLPGVQVTYQAPTSAPAALPAAGPALGSGSGGTEGRFPRVPRRAYAGRERAPFVPSGGRGQSLPKLPALGSWGERLAQLPPTSRPTGGSSTATDAGTEKPAGTFAAEPGADGALTPPLRRQAGTVQLTFVPPPSKPVGEAVVGELTVSSQAEAMITLRVTTEQGLRVTNARRGVVYAGPMRSGAALHVPLRLLAWKPGTHRLRVQLESDVAGVAADLEIVLSEFVGDMGKNGEAVVSLRLYETPSLRAIRKLAAAAGERVVIHEGVEAKVVTLDFSAGVPFAAALRILCDDCGYRVEERDGVYHILR